MCSREDSFANIMGTGIAVTNAGLRKLGSLSVPKHDTATRGTWSQKRRSPTNSHREMASMTANSGRGFITPESVPLLARTSATSSQMQQRGVRTQAMSDDIDPEVVDGEQSEIDYGATALAFTFPATAGMLFGYDIGATSGAKIELS